MLKLIDNGTAMREVSPHGCYQTTGTYASWRDGTASPVCPRR